MYYTMYTMYYTLKGGANNESGSGKEKASNNPIHVPLL